MFRRESKKLILALLILEAVACGLLCVGPFLFVGGMVTWFLSLFTVGLSPLYLGTGFVIAGVCFTPLSVFSLIFAVGQQRKFKTPLGIPTAITAGAHLILTALSLCYIWSL